MILQSLVGKPVRVLFLQWAGADRGQKAGFQPTMVVGILDSVEGTLAKVVSPEVDNGYFIVNTACLTFQSIQPN